MNTRAFFRALWPIDVEGALTFWFRPSKRSAHMALERFFSLAEGDLDDLHNDNEDGAHIYFGLGLRKLGLPPSRQGGKKDVIALPGFALDFDRAHPTAHVAQNLPRTDEELYQVIEHAPTPTIIVESGSGWHVYWLFHQPLFLTTAGQQAHAQAVYKEFQQQFIDRSAEVGWHLDNTASIQRVWRVPGFKNPKSGNLVEVKHFDDAQRYSFEDFSGGKSLSTKSSTTKKKKSSAAENKAPAELIAALQSLSDENRNKKMVVAILAGKSFAEPGERDESLQRVCSTLAWLPVAREMTAEDIAEVLRPSLSVWANEEDNPKRLSIDEELAKAIDKIKRAQDDYHDHQARQHEQLSGLREALRISDDDSEDEDEISNEHVLHHSIIQFRSSFYVYHFRDGRYAGPKTKDELLTYAREAWREGPDGLDLEYYNAKGQLKQKSVPRILHEYATNADQVIGHLALQQGKYDRLLNVFHESVAPVRRDLEPEFDPAIDEWLRCLGGEHADKLLDWIAGVTMLDQQCAALYLDGSPGSGKGLLAEGLARLYRHAGPTPLEDVLGDFNADIFQCPLLFLDEGLPKSKGNVSAQLRSLIGRSSFNYKQKNLANRPVLGSARLLIAANNDNVLAFGDERMSANDLEAYTKRFLYIPVSTEANQWLIENNPGRKLSVGWVTGSGIARHSLWLAQNRVITPGERFLVEGSMTDMHRKLVLQGEASGQVYEWLTRFASNPEELYRNYKIKKETPKALIGDERLWVNTQGVIDSWDLYMKKDFQRPSTRRLGQILRQLSKGSTRPGSRGDRTTYHDIRFDLVLRWAADTQIGDELAMRRHFNKQEETDSEVA